VAVLAHRETVRELPRPDGRKRGLARVVRPLNEANWPKSTIARGDLADEIGALKRQPGGEIIAWGGAEFAQALSRSGLMDEYSIVMQPVAYGGGKAVFGDLPDALHLRLLATTIFLTGPC
jgi:dihydrofolate reductase